jgi:hypothetical protein
MGGMDTTKKTADLSRLVAYGWRAMPDNDVHYVYAIALYGSPIRPRHLNAASPIATAFDLICLQDRLALLHEGR